MSPRSHDEVFGIGAYILTDEDVGVLTALAEARQRHWRSKGVRNKRIAATKSAMSVEVDGVLGEYGACMLLGIPFDDSVGKPDGGVDGHLCGRPIQIKTTGPASRMLLFPSVEDLRADVAVLAILDGRSVTLAGWIGRHDLAAAVRRHGLKTITSAYGDQPWMWISEMRPMDTLLPTLEAHPPAAPVLPPTARETDDPLAGEQDEDWRPEGGWPSWVYERARRDDPSLDMPRNVRRADCLEPLIPEQYRGKTWPLVAGQPASSRFPPMRDDPQGPVTAVFIDFQEHNHARVRREHPEYYCVECRGVYVTAVCPECKSGRVGPTGEEREGRGTPYRCNTCGWTFFAALVCHFCREKLKERYGGQLALPEPLVRERKSGGRRRRPKELEDARIPGMD